MKTWFLKCNSDGSYVELDSTGGSECGFRLPNNSAANPKCPDCGERMHVIKEERTSTSKHPYDIRSTVGKIEWLTREQAEERWWV